jgi:hypothetical protein
MAEDEPAAGLLNLFDVWIAFAAAPLRALASPFNLPELINPKAQAAVITRPGNPEMEIITKQGTKIDHYRVTEEKLKGKGLRLGTAYRLKSGEVVYVPEATTTTIP